MSTLLVIFGVLDVHGHEPEAQAPFERPHAHESAVGNFHTGWESRYLSEGRDSLDGDSLWTAAIELGWEHLSGGLWYGNSPEQDYDEVQLSLALTESAGDFELYGAYTHLRFPFDHSHDNEIGAGLKWSGLPSGVSAAADAYYSFDADGSFIEASVSWDLDLSERVRINVSNVVGFNQGYVSDGHDGANHVALRLGTHYRVTDSVSIAAHIAHSWALQRDSSLSGDDLLTDFFIGGASLHWTT